MTKSFTERKRIRTSFGRIRESLEMPNLIEVQHNSYNQFLQMTSKPESRAVSGLEEVFRSVFPIKDFTGRAELDFVRYELEDPKYDQEECQQRDMTYASALRVTLRLSVFDVDERTGVRSVRDIKEQDVYMGDLPLMTDKGTFVINGTERVIVSQMHRSPGVFFDHDRGRVHSSGKFLFSARIIPYRGAWLDFEFDAKDILYVRIDRRRKLPATTLLYALYDDATEAQISELQAMGEELGLMEGQGMSKEDILANFYESWTVTRTENSWESDFNGSALLGRKLQFDLVNADTGEITLEAGRKVTQRQLDKLEESNFKRQRIAETDLVGSYLALDIIDESNGLVLYEAGDEVTADVLVDFEERNITEISLLAIDHINVGAQIRTTLAADRCRCREEALIDIYRVMRPGEPPTLETAEALFQGLFFDKERYDLSAVGRVKLNARLGFETDDSLRVLRKADLLKILKILNELKDGKGDIDDIDHLGNRRVRSVGEMMENQYRLGLLRMERAIRERMGTVDIDTVMPHDLINAKPAAAAVREFFSSSQLSQFMDQTNPLSEITHKRRLSALGPGGLTRERAGFEVRDVHPTHYGRICPIETPEGPNIGLINSLATYGRVNQYGFIESPYRKVIDSRVTNDVVYLSAMDEAKYTIAEANAPVDENGALVEEFISARIEGEYAMVSRDQVNMIDVSPKQLVSIAAALIPFLENDDANRALMGSNMQRQAVPLLRADAPFVGTGMEAIVARDSGAAVTAGRAGIVDQVDGERIVIRATEDVPADRPGIDIYKLHKFRRSNQSTCINQRPLVRVGDKVSRNDIIADGPSTDLGELALGRNVLVAFMPWNGYNFEDSILISERIVSEDVFTSIHIEEYEVMARDTKLGQEEISRDIPNVSEDALRNLDEAGIIYVGAEVKPGDILVGKVTPKGETPMTPEEKLLRAIFGEKASDVRDTSLRVPPGQTGTVVDVRVFSRRGIDKDERAIAIERQEIEFLAKDRDDERKILERNFFERLREHLIGQTATHGPNGFRLNVPIGDAELSEVSQGQWRQLSLEDDQAQSDFESMFAVFDRVVTELEDRFNDKVEKLQRGDELSPGVMKMVKVYIAEKRKLQPGDKMAGRHGNKGVISRIVPQEDIPWLEDGTPVDIVLNPLGVPSRMNVGQILETHLGMAAKGLGEMISKSVAAYRTAVRRDDNVNTDGIRSAMGSVFGTEAAQKATEGLNDNELLELGDNLSRGVPFATPVFDGAREPDINRMLERAGLDVSGQSVLIDGRTGEPFDRKVTVGYIYMLKLHHLVDDKIHARSTGPYSLVTQQPLGGKAQFGGQRFGEMEVWALEAYGAAHTLQEILTVKSDDVSGRTKVYESIVRGDNSFETGIPESFNVLIKELRALGLSMELEQS